MSNSILRASRQYLRPIIVAASLCSLTQAPHAAAQATPVPFITTFAGLAAGASPANAICSASLPVYSVTGTGASYGDGCVATQASLSSPIGVATDKLGNVFISDQSHQIIRVVYNGGAALAAAITAANIQNPGLVPVKGDIYTIAGGPTVAPTTHYCNGAGTGPMGSDLELDECPGAQTYQYLNRGVAVDADGNVFLSNGAVYSTIRVFYVGGAKAAALIQLADPTVTPQPGYVYKVAGYGGSSFVTAGNHCTGSTTLTFTDALGDGCPAAQAFMNQPRGLFIDGSEDIYFADQADNVIRRIDGTTSIITNVAGQCMGTTSCTATPTSGDGNPATSSAVNIYAPYGVVLDQYGNIFIAEGGSSTLAGRVRVVYTAGTLPGIAKPTPGFIYTYAGGAANAGTPAQMAAFQLTYGVGMDIAGYLYIADYRSGTSASNHIWRVDPVSGNILILAGTGNTSLLNGQHCDRVKQLGIVSSNNLGDTCPATQAYLNTPQGQITFDSAGNGYFADRGNNVIRKLNYNNVFPATAVGSTSALQPQAFYFPATTSILSKSATLQGTPTTEFASLTTANDNCPLSAPLPAAPDTCVSYVTFTPAAAGPRSAAYNLSDVTGVVATSALVGIGTAPVLSISPGAAATIGTAITPAAISTDLHGNVYTSDARNHQVLRSTVAGGAGTAILTGLGSPRQSAVDNFGNFYVADALNNDIVRLPAVGTASTTFGSGLSAPQGIVADLAGNVYIADTGNNRLLYYNPIIGNTTPVSTYPIALSAPTSLALDASGNLYIVDTNNTRVVELPTGLFPTVLTLPVGVAPAALAFDPANDTYLADTASGSILFVPAGTTTATPLITGVTSPVGLAVGPTGNIFVADSFSTSAAAYNTAVNNSTFTTTNIPGSSLPVTLTVSDVGNLSATLAKPPYTETGSATVFASYGTPTCAATFVLTAGASCTQAFVFTPAVAGLQTAKVVFNATTGQSVTANFTATATSLIGTAITIAPLTATATYGQTVTYTAALTPNSITTPAPSGTINFVVDGKIVNSSSVTGSPYSFTFTLSTFVGIHTVAVDYTGDSVYGGSDAMTFLTVGKAITSVAASSTQTAAGTLLKAVVTPANVGAIVFSGNVLFYIDNSLVATVPVNGGVLQGIATATILVPDGTHMYYASYTGDPNYAGSTSTPVQTLVISRAATTTSLALNTSTNAGGTAGYLFSAKVSSATPGTPTGTVAFANGATVMATVNLSTAINGVVTFFTTNTTYTSYIFTATYSGDGLFEPSTSLVPQFLLIAPLNVNVAQGGQTNPSFSVAPINGYSGSLTAACTGLPTNAVCRFYPTPIVVSGTSNVSFNVQIYAGVNPNVSSMARPALSPLGNGATLAILLLAPAVLGSRRRRRRAAPSYLLAIAALSAAALGITGCGLKTPAYTPPVYTTPAGTYPITVTLIDANGLSQSNTFNVIVGQ